MLCNKIASTYCSNEDITNIELCCTLNSLYSLFPSLLEQSDSIIIQYLHIILNQTVRLYKQKNTNILQENSEKVQSFILSLLSRCILINSSKMIQLISTLYITQNVIEALIDRYLSRSNELIKHNVGRLNVIGLILLVTKGNGLSKALGVKQFAQSVIEIERSRSKINLAEDCVSDLV